MEAETQTRDSIRGRRGRGWAVQSSGKEPPRAGPLAGEADKPQWEKQRGLGCSRPSVSSGDPLTFLKALPGPQGRVGGPRTLHGRVTCPEPPWVQHNNHSACSSGVWGPNP